MRTIEEILQSTSESLYPAEMGERLVQLDSCDWDGDTPLHVMLWRRDMEGALTLIAAGAPVDAIGDMGETPLHVAIRQGTIEIAEALLLAGANPQIRCEFGDTPHERALAAGGRMAQLFESRPHRSVCAADD